MTDERTTTSSTRRDWIIPASLILLSAFPIAVGALRLGQLAGGTPKAAETAHFFATPLPVVLHIVSSTLFCILGAFQFAPGFRRRRPGWHRVSGRILIPTGLIAALTGLWMVQFFPHINFDGPILYVIRLGVGSAMVLFLWLGFAAIRRRKIRAHRAWMIRSFALGLGAGTQVLTHMPLLLIPAIQGELARAVAMSAGWAINLAVAEWVIRRTVTGRRAAVVGRLAEAS